MRKAFVEALGRKRNAGLGDRVGQPTALSSSPNSRSKGEKKLLAKKPQRRRRMGDSVHTQTHAMQDAGVRGYKQHELTENMYEVLRRNDGDEAEVGLSVGMARASRVQ